MSQDSVSGESSSAAGGNVWGLDCPAPLQPGLQSRSQPPAVEAQQSLPSDPAENVHCPRRGESGCPPAVDGLGAQAGVESVEQCKLVKMSLYVHCIKGLVLSLLAEDHLREDQSSAEDVVSGKLLPACRYHSLLPARCWGHGLHLRRWIALPVAFLTCSVLCKAKPFGLGLGTTTKAAWEVVRKRKAASPRGESVVSQATPVACCCLTVPAPERKVWV